MTRFNVNTAYFMHSTPAYNRAHKEENSKYNHKYYEEHKEKWQDNDEDEDDDNDNDSTESKSGSEKDDEKDSKDKKSGSGSSKKEKKLTLNGGSKKGGSATGKKKTEKKSSEKKKKETDEEKEKRLAEEKAEKERKQEEERKKNAEYAEQLKKMQEQLAEKQKGTKKTKPNVRKYNSAVKHSAVYVGINSQPYFQHHGRLGMKWGKRNGPPYPLDYSKLSEEERIKDKARVKEEGDIESVAYKKNRSYFSDQEINDVINRYQLNTRINQLSADSAKMKAGKSKTEQLVDNMAKVADVGNKLSNALNAGTNVYNNVAKIMNAFGDSDLPIIGQSKEKKSQTTKLSKKDLDKMISNLDKNMQNYSNQELQDAVKRKTMYDTLTKDSKNSNSQSTSNNSQKTESKTENKSTNETINSGKKVVDSVSKKTIKEMTSNKDVVDVARSLIEGNRREYGTGGLKIGPNENPNYSRVITMDEIEDYLRKV